MRRSVLSRRWTTGKQLAGNPGTVFASLSAEPSGNGMSAWTEVAKHVVVRRYKADGGWSPAENFDPVVDDGTARPELGSNGAGTTWVAWSLPG